MFNIKGRQGFISGKGGGLEAYHLLLALLYYCCCNCCLQVHEPVCSV